MAAATGFGAARAQAAAIPEEAYARLNRALILNHVVPRYRAFARAAGAFDTASGAYCAKRTPAGLAAAQDAFRRTLSAWMGIQHIHFGPVELFSRQSRIHFWPQARGKIGRAVDRFLESGDASRFAADNFSRASAAVQGLPAAEYLLFAVLAGKGADGPRAAAACRHLVAIAGYLHRGGTDIAQNWLGGRMKFIDVLATPGPRNDYFRTHKDITQAIFKSFHDELQLIVDAKLKPVVGASAAKVRPRMAESRLSTRSLANIVDNLTALQALYHGEGGPGLDALARKFGADAKLPPLMRRAFLLTIANARSIKAPLARAARDPALRPRVEKLLLQVRALKQIVRDRLAAALGVAAGFNALDGD